MCAPQTIVRSLRGHLYPDSLVDNCSLSLSLLQEDYPAFLKETIGLVKDGKLKYEETVVEGFENTVKAFQGLFKGQNTGKMVVKV